MSGLWITEDDLYDPTNPDAPEAARAASLLLFQLSGRKYSGVHTVTEFYEQPDACLGSVRREEVQLSLEVFRIGGYRGGNCASHPHQRLRLRGQPVRSVSSVIAGFETERRDIPDEEWQVIDRTYLRPVIGASWTPCSNMEVTYTYGVQVPEAGLRAARMMGDELLRARIDPSNCCLPDRVTSISRQGVSFTVLDAQDFLKDGRTGIYEVDLFLKAANPDNARKRARVFTPDTPRAGRVTST